MLLVLTSLVGISHALLQKSIALLIGVKSFHVAAKINRVRALLVHQFVLIITTSNFLVKKRVKMILETLFLANLSALTQMVI